MKVISNVRVILCVCTNAVHRQRFSGIMWNRCRGKVTADVLIGELNCGAFATRWIRGGRVDRDEEEENGETRFIQLRAPGNIIR